MMRIVAGVKVYNLRLLACLTLSDAIRVLDTDIFEPESCHPPHGNNFRLKISTNAPRRVNILSSGYFERERNSLSGGHQAIVGFAEYLQHVSGSHGAFQPRVLDSPNHDMHNCEHCEFAGGKEVPLEVSPEDVFVATRLPTTARQADYYACLVNTIPVFYIQDSEHLFSSRAEDVADVMSIYMIPHLSIYNCEPLYRYFEIEKAVPSRSVSQGIYFQPRVPKDILASITPATDDRILKVLVYGRNLRNVPSDATHGLRLAIQQGAFKDGRWEFYMVGGVAEDLGAGHTLRNLPWTPANMWNSMLRQFTLGIVLMECASLPFSAFDFPVASILTVTNAYAGRDNKWFEGLSPLYEVAQNHTPASVAQAISRAVSRLNGDMKLAKRQDLAARLRDRLPATWEDSFAPIGGGLREVFQKASTLGRSEALTDSYA